MLKSICKTGFCLLVFCSMCLGADVKISSEKALIVDGKPFFPISAYWQPLDNIEYLNGLGIDTFFIFNCDFKGYLDKLAAKKAYGFILISDYKDELKNHPALLGWMHDDEPDIAGGNPMKAPRIPPEKILAAYNFIKSKDSSHPVFLNFGSDQTLPIKMYKEFAKGAEILSFDIYPINQINDSALHVIGKGIDKMKKYCDDKKPCWIWLECSMIGSEKGQKSKIRRAPTSSEVKTEVWMAIIHGAKSIGYFTHSWVSSYKPCDIPADVAKAMKEINAKVKLLSDVILSPDAKREVQCEAAGDVGKIDILVKEMDNKIYIFAVNMKKAPEKGKFVVPGIKDSEADVQDEGRKIKIKGGGFEDNFKEYEVHIYEIPMK